MGVNDQPDWVDDVDRARHGDAEAQGLLFARFMPLARATASGLTEPADVDDVLQEAFAEASRTLPDLRTAAAFPSWLRLLVRKHADRARRRSQPTVVLADLAGSAVDDPAEVTERRLIAEIIRVALGSVSGADRRLLELRYLAGWSNADLADAMCVSHGAVRKRLFDARRRLRPYLQDLDPKETSMTDYRTYLGAVHRADIAVDEPPPLSRLDMPAPSPTGLKVIDTIAPIARGGTIELGGPSGTGQVVVALELLFRIGNAEAGTACVGVGVAGSPVGSQPDLGSIVGDPAITQPMTAALADTTSQTAQAFEAGARIASGLAAGGLDVMLIVDAPTTATVGLSALTTACGLSESGGAVTLAAISAGEQKAPETTPIGLDTTLVFSIEQLALGIFPAIDPKQTSSTLLTPGQAADVRDALAQSAELQAWFNQPLYVAQDHTGLAGTWIDPQDSINELAGLLT